MELCSMLCDSLDGRGTCGEWMCVYLQLSPFAVHLKLSHSLLISRTPIQNLKKQKFPLGKGNCATRKLETIEM